ncbi:H-NS histone family protein [Burkholderia pyrrocinia]|uniref:H-NS histone family protein n=1 Tax=Burkholderia pyrrocinia TaxID=60550 RepID=UPI0030CA813F
MSTYRELLRQLEELKKEIDIAREREAELIAKRVVDLLVEYGIFRHDVLTQQDRNRRRRAPVRPKYFDPKSGATWSGRGRTPRWLIGKDIEQFRISQSDEGPQRE